MSKTITIEIPAPPEGWAHEKRKPAYQESYYFLNASGVWQFCTFSGRLTFTPAFYAFRQRDEYAERFEALKLPDGWAWENGERPEYTEWSNDANSPEEIISRLKPSCRRIINGKAVKP